MKTFAVLLLCIFALCSCQDHEAEGNAGGSEGDQKSGKHKPGNPNAEYWENMDKVCRPKVKVTQDDMKNMVEMWNTGKCSNEPSEEARCYMKCVLNVQKKMKEDGTPTLEELHQKYTLMAQKISECNKIKADTPCASSYPIVSCLVEVGRIATGL